jgi:hypothetical protein
VPRRRRQISRRCARLALEQARPISVRERLTDANEAREAAFRDALPDLSGIRE